MLDFTLLDQHLSPKFKGKPNLYFLQIGNLDESKTIIWFLENLLTGDSVSLYCIDNFSDPAKTVNFDQATSSFVDKLDPKRKKAWKLNGNTLDYFRSNAWRRPMFDLVLIDSGRPAKDLILDLELSFRLIKQGGVIMYENLAPDKAVESSTKMAIDLFKASHYSNEYKILTEDKCTILEKL